MCLAAWMARKENTYVDFNSVHLVAVYLVPCIFEKVRTMYRGIPG